MTVYVLRNGVLVERRVDLKVNADFPMPMLSRMEPYESPVTEKEITSWRDRDRDMAAAGAVDPRDMPPPTRGRASTKKGDHDGSRKSDDTGFKWSRPPD